MNLLIEVGNLDGLIYLILAIMFGPPILLGVVGALLYKNNKKAAKVFFILATLYVVISLGLCGTMLM